VNTVLLDATTPAIGTQVAKSSADSWTLALQVSVTSTVTLALSTAPLKVTTTSELVATLRAASGVTLATVAPAPVVPVEPELELVAVEPPELEDALELELELALELEVALELELELVLEVELDPDVAVEPELALADEVELEPALDDAALEPALELAPELPVEAPVLPPEPELVPLVPVALALELTVVIACVPLVEPVKTPVLVSVTMPVLDPPEQPATTSNPSHPRRALDMTASRWATLLPVRLLAGPAHWWRWSRLPPPMTDTATPASPRLAYVAIALTSCAVLLFEVAITRVLSVVLWYHFAFLAISLAMLGLSLPGVWFTLRKPSPRSLPLSLLASGVVVPASLAVLFKAGEVVTQAQTATPGLDTFLHGGMLLVIGCVLAPLLCLGSAVCLLLMQAEGRSVGRMYAADLLGGTVGAALVVPLMQSVPTPLIIAGSALLPLVSAALVSRRSALAAGGLAAALVGAMVWGEPFRLRVSKSYVEPENLLFMKWTPTARITIFPGIFYEKDTKAGFGWGMGDRYKPQPLEQLWIEQDGSAGTPITKLDGDIHAATTVPHLFFDVTSVGYQVRPPKRSCVIGAGGGRDILTALKAGATDVDAVELNPATVEALSGPFKGFSGDVYHLPGVHAVVGEGRSFLTHSRGEYDFLQISLIDSWAATAAGAFALSENYLYTVDALRLYIRRLAPGGMLSISRWMAGDRQLEGARLSMMAMKALELEGIREPRKHLAVVQAWGVGTFLFSRTPFDDAEIRQLDEVCNERGFLRHWPRYPGTPKDSIVARVIEKGTGMYTEKGFDLSPPTDNKPFFFQTVSILGGADPALLAQLSNNEQSVSMLRFLLAMMSVLTLGLFFLPFAFAGRTRADGKPMLTRGPELWLGSGYFVFIGVAFMLIEMPFMQRFVLYLGHPSYATTVVLASLLLGAGTGSFAASRLDGAGVRRYGLLLPLGLVLINVLLGPIYAATLGWDFGERVAVSALLLVPAGFLMGFPFPSGMAAFKDDNKPWFWAMNGAAGVLASVFSLALSMLVGFFDAGLLGAAFYLAAYGLLVAMARQPAPVTPA
jgi:hypothetical protein